MRTLRARLRRAWAALTGTGAAASVAFGLLVFVSVLASLAIPRESGELRTGALHRVIAAAGLLLAALVVLALQAVITYQRGSARALRIDD
jgi:hypothetical protein